VSCFRAEVIFRVSGNNYRAVVEKEDLYAAIDGVKDVLTQEVKSGKQKRMSIVRRGAQRVKDMLQFRKENNANE
jgi:ribosome-associated translation inhibitor RaiA